MPQESRHQLAEIFALAGELPPAERATYLDRECAGKPKLRRQIEDLLAQDHVQDDLLEHLAWEAITIETRDVEGVLPRSNSLEPLLSKSPIGRVFQNRSMRLESLPGSILDQKYRIERQLGKGAMGAVFQAVHLGTTRTVSS